MLRIDRNKLVLLTSDAASAPAGVGLFYRVPSDRNSHVADPPRNTGASIRLRNIENPYIRNALSCTQRTRDGPVGRDCTTCRRCTLETVGCTQRNVMIHLCGCMCIFAEVPFLQCVLEVCSDQWDVREQPRTISSRSTPNRPRSTPNPPPPGSSKSRTNQSSNPFRGSCL